MDGLAQRATEQSHCGLQMPKVRHPTVFIFTEVIRPKVEALPFTSEGYNRAKSILESKYGKEYEIVKAYTKANLGLASNN